MVKYSNESWIQEAEKKYPGRFGYDKTNYIDSYHKVTITCLEHNESFQVSPIALIKSSSFGNPCPICNPNIKQINKKPNIDLVKYYTENLDLGKDPGIFYRIKYIHKPSKIEFLKIGSSPISLYQNNFDCVDFDFEVIEEVKATNIEAIKLELSYKKKNKPNRFFLPKNIDFFNRDQLFEIDGYHQLLSSQVKFIRDCLLEKQNCKCPLCDRVVELPTLDHYHGRKQYGSGLIRGVICNTCNRMVGVIENNFIRNSIDYSDAPQFLARLIPYLRDSREHYLHPTEKPKNPKLMKSSYNKLIKKISGKQKVPKYNGHFTKQLEILFQKYNIVPEFKG